VAQMPVMGQGVGKILLEGLHVASSASLAAEYNPLDVPGVAMLGAPAASRLSLARRTHR